nr:glycosyltransferase family 2 protein [Mesorhizobium albiziae]
MLDEASRFGGRQRCDLVASGENAVCVIIAAMNASATIGAAVRSALREPEVTEVVVVDDGSSDGTAEAAMAAGDGSGRLKIIRLETNKGPSFARNQAIAASTAPLIGILDADDFFLEGRFRNLLQDNDWDFIADNIVFIEEGRAEPAVQEIQRFAAEPFFLDLAGFVDGNISRRGAERGEIGFLKPVMRRSFLAAHALSYREEMRLGEDYDLYARALSRGARYKVVHNCGYGATVRPNSLSGRHRTEDLKRLYEADRAILGVPNLPRDAATALASHESHVRAKYELRRFLDIKANAGLAAAAFHALGNPGAMPAIVSGIAADKFSASRATPKSPTHGGAGDFRYLLQPAQAVQR